MEITILVDFEVVEAYIKGCGHITLVSSGRHCERGGWNEKLQDSDFIEYQEPVELIVSSTPKGLVEFNGLMELVIQAEGGD